mmetsp:Transcript_56183/g.135937  ORF Transcript_56183/g.135937 Transcript_56183/m.135937 type:complete len:85 (-) Transcript_56183:35-289(-)
MRYNPGSPLKRKLMHTAASLPRLLKNAAACLRLSVRGGFLLFAIYFSRKEHFAWTWLAAVASMVAYEASARVSRALALWLLVGR